MSRAIWRGLLAIAAALAIAGCACAKAPAPLASKVEAAAPPPPEATEKQAALQDKGGDDQFGPGGLGLKGTGEGGGGQAHGTVLAPPKMAPRDAVRRDVAKKSAAHGLFKFEESEIDLEAARKAFGGEAKPAAAPAPSSGQPAEARLEWREKAKAETRAPAAAVDGKAAGSLGAGSRSRFYADNGEADKDGKEDASGKKADKRGEATLDAVAEPATEKNLADEAAPEKKAAEMPQSNLSVTDSAQPGEFDACTSDEPPTARPLPRRCHLLPNYHAASSYWRNRLAALQQLPQELLAFLPELSGRADLDPPTVGALAVNLKVDRDAVQGPATMWLRIGLRSTDRWGMRRPPFDLAVVVSPAAAAMPAQTCRALRGLAARIEAQDRLTVVLQGAGPAAIDDAAGAQAADKLAALCDNGKLQVSGELASTHRLARALLFAHANAQHRVAGTRAVVVVAAGNDSAEPLQASVSEGVMEPTLTSALLVAPPAQPGAWLTLCDTGHGSLELGAEGQEAAAAERLWADWARVVARLVRVDLRLGPNVVALRVLGSRVLDADETKAVRDREQAIDNNLARVASVARDRQNDGEGMTMLLPAFLGSDEHAIDVQIRVAGPGPVATVAVDYKDMVRMANAKAFAAVQVDRLQPALSHTMPQPERNRLAGPWLGQFKDGLSQASAAAPIEWPADLVRNGAAEALQRAAAQAKDSLAVRQALLALVDALLAERRGCHVAAAGL